MTKAIKIAILGDGASGKTSLLRARQHEKFDMYSKLTIGVEVACLPLEFCEDKIDETALLAFDLGGQERFHFIHDAYIKGIRAAIILYDVTRYTTFLNLKKWVVLALAENPNIALFIVGNKVDAVGKEDLKIFKDEWAKTFEIIKQKDMIKRHYFVSSKTSEWLEELFKDIEIEARAIEI